MAPPILPPYTAGDASPRAWLDSCIAVIESREPALHAFTALDLDAARAAADAAEARKRAGRPLSPIDGMPIAVKDLIETKGLPTQFGSAAFAGWSGNRDAAPVHALRQAGAVIVGKTVTTEFGIGGPGPTRNPHDPARTPGGSSSGSGAAVGAGMVPAALGTQVGGSVLRPASFCGVIGFKPTYGALNRGQLSDQFSQNCLGVLAADLADLWAVCHEIASRVGGDPGHLPFAGGARPAPARRPDTLAVLETAGWPIADAAARSALQAELRRLSAAGTRLLDRTNSPRIALLERAIAEAAEISSAIASWESLWPIGELHDRHPGKLHPRTVEHVTQGRAMTAEAYATMLRRRDAVRDALLALAPDIDACVTLAAPGAAPVGIETTGNAIFNLPASCLRCPAISLPLLEADGLPLGLQLLGYPNQERALSALAAWFLRRGD
jgi:Asp-tRNA(Asn)/Glu-tRNA(Gln) amidotransferase A subunit family amidase